MGNPGYQTCTKAGEVYDNGLSLVHSFQNECLQLVDLEFCFSMTDDELPNVPGNPGDFRFLS